MRGASSALAGGRSSERCGAVWGNGGHQRDGLFLERRTSKRRYLYLSGRGALGKMRLFLERRTSKRWAVFGTANIKEEIPLP